MLFKATLFSLVAVLALATVSVAEDNIHGNYILDSDLNNEDVMKVLDAMGFPEKTKNGVAATKKVLVILTKDNGTHSTARIVIKGKGSFDTTFESGKEFESNLPDGRTVKNTVTIDHEKQTIHHVYKMDGFEATSDTKFCASGFEITMKAKDAVAVIKFKRFTQVGDIEAVKKSYF